MQQLEILLKFDYFSVSTFFQNKIFVLVNFLKAKKTFFKNHFNIISNMNIY